MKLVKFTKVPCTNQPLADSERPTCPAGTADNTPIEMFGISTCQRASTTSPSDWINEHFPEWFRKSWQPAAVYKVEFAPNFKAVFPYENAVVFGKPGGQMWTLFLDNAGAVIGENMGCGLWNLLVNIDRTKFILPPNRPPQS